MRKRETHRFERRLVELRSKFESGFSTESAAPGFHGKTPSTGQCAAVSVIVSQLTGAAMASTRIEGLSHWFNRLAVGGEDYDFDLTGDQFGLPSIQHAKAGMLYPETRVRSEKDLNAETLRRARLLARRAGFSTVAMSLESAIAPRDD